MLLSRADWHRGISEPLPVLQTPMAVEHRAVPTRGGSTICLGMENEVTSEVPTAITQVELHQSGLSHFDALHAVEPDPLRSFQLAAPRHNLMCHALQRRAAELKSQSQRPLERTHGHGG